MRVWALSYDVVISSLTALDQILVCEGERDRLGHLVRLSH